MVDVVDPLQMRVFQARDGVRHPLVQRIVQAYDAHEDRATPLDTGKL